MSNDAEPSRQVGPSAVKKSRYDNFDTAAQNTDSPFPELHGRMGSTNTNGVTEDDTAINKGENTTNTSEIISVRKTFKHPFTCLVTGVSGCGKTEFIMQLLNEMDVIISPQVHKVFWVYGTYHQRLQDAQEIFPNLRLSSSLEQAFKHAEEEIKPSLMIIDDCMQSGGKSDQMADLFTKGSHHKNISVVFVLQNLFHRGRTMRDIHMNTHYMVLFKSPRDRAQVNHLARQIFPGETKYFMEAFNDATKDPFGYLIIDLKPATPENRRLKSKIFSSEPLCVYVPRDSI